MSQYNCLSEIQEAIKQKRLNLPALVNEHIAVIDEQPLINAFVEVYRTEAISRADAIQQKIESGSYGRLAGLIISVKDNICHQGHVSSAASKILKDYQSPFTATALKKMLDEDAIVIGRTNCDEFGMGSDNKNSAYGSVLNPAFMDYSPGGSSGGAAASVAMGACHLALGSDTGGSIRQPAAYNNIIGLKPSYGAISRFGLIAYGSSFDQIGILAKNLDDVSIVFDLVKGKDENDATSKDFMQIEAVPSIKNTRVCFLENAINHSSLDSKLKEDILSFSNKLKNNVAAFELFQLEEIDLLVPAYYILASAEAASNLARYDGAHFGHRSPNSTNLEEMYTKSRSEGFGPEVKRRILLGNFVLSEGYKDDVFEQAKLVRQHITDKLNKLLEDFDILCLPTTPSYPPKLSDVDSDPTQAYLGDIFTTLASLAGLPAISVPIASQSNFPAAIQLIGKMGSEAQLLYFASEIGKGNV